MPDKNNTQLDPILLRMMRTPGRPSPTPGAGAFVDNPFLLRQLQGMQPRIMGGGGVKSTINPGSKAKPSSFIPEGYNKEDVLRFLQHYGIPIDKDRPAKETDTSYVSYHPPGNPFRGGPVPNHPKIRFPGEDDPHMGVVRGRERETLIDTIGKKDQRPGRDLSAAINARGEGYDNPKALMDAIFWRTGVRLTPYGSQPSILRENPGANTPKTPVNPNLVPEQSNILGSMLHLDKEQRAPVISGGTPDSPMSSQQLGQRFNLVTPKDLGNTGPQEYDPMKDPNFAKLLNLVRKYNLPSGND